MLRSIYSIALHADPYARTRLPAGILLHLAERGLLLIPLLVVFSAPVLSGFFAGYIEVTLMLLLLIGTHGVLQYGALLNSFLGTHRLLDAYRSSLLERIRTSAVQRIMGQRAQRFSELLTEDISRLEAVFSHQFPDIVAASGLIVLLLLGLFVIDVPSGLMSAGSLLLSLVVLGYFQTRFADETERKKSSFSHTASVLGEMLDGMLTLRLFASPAWLDQRLAPDFARLRQRAMDVELWGALPTLSARLIADAGFASVAVYLLWRLTEQNLELEAALLIAGLSYFALDIASELFTQITMLRYGLQSEQRLSRLQTLQTLPEPQSPQSPNGLDIRIDGMSYRYAESDHDALDEISVCIPAGSTVALVGVSGSGKSTLLNLIARFDDPTRGSIRLGKVDYQDLGSDQLHPLMSLVSQDVQLVQGSMRDNILLGNSQASEEDFQYVAKLSGCRMISERFEQRYETLIGVGGSHLSGGERQCIALARALLKSAPIVLLDEATASLDGALQRHIQQGLQALTHNRTLIMVAHRLESITHADQILVFEGGCLMQSGRHEELRDEPGLYQTLWQHRQ